MAEHSSQSGSDLRMSGATSLLPSPHMFHAVHRHDHYHLFASYSYKFKASTFTFPPTTFQTNFTTRTRGNTIESSDEYNYVPVYCLTT